MTIITSIKSKLASLNPHLLEIQDESYKHIGHPGHSKVQHSHLKIIIISDIFEGKKLPERHKIIYNILKNEMSHIHALSIVAKSSQEV